MIRTVTEYYYNWDDKANLLIEDGWVLTHFCTVGSSSTNYVGVFQKGDDNV